jgi:penicillin-binding protein 2
VTFRNWSSAYYGYIGFPESLEISCDTFYYQLGWAMESRWGKGLQSGDGSERFQKYMRRAGFGHPTGVDLPGEIGGSVPDQEWLESYCDAIDNPPGCDTWFPGYTVNMSIGQGDLIATPIQMATTYSAVLNGGKVLEPRLGTALGIPDLATTETGDEEIVREFDSEVAANLPLDETELDVLRQGLEDVVMGSSGTARGAFAGFPLDEHPLGGKTGTAQIGTTDFNRAWFVGYGPTDEPKYVIAVYINYADHGGTSAAPVAREVFEGIFKIDKTTEDVTFGSDSSG